MNGWWWIGGRKPLTGKSSLGGRSGLAAVWQSLFHRPLRFSRDGEWTDWQETQGWMFEQEKSHLHWLHTSLNSEGGCSLGQGLSVGFRYVLGRSKNMSSTHRSSLGLGSSSATSRGWGSPQAVQIPWQGEDKERTNGSKHKARSAGDGVGWAGSMDWPLQIGNEHWGW